MLWSFCIVWHFYFEPGIVLVNFCMVWKHPYFKHMLKMSFNPTDVIFWKSNKMYSFQMDVGFLPVDPCLQCHMVSVTLMILFSWDMTLCERVIRLQLSEVMYCPFLSGSWGTYVSHKLVCVCVCVCVCVICRICYVHFLIILLYLYVQQQTSE